MASYKLIVKNAKVILKTVTNAVLNITGIKDLLTGSGSVDSNTKIDWTLQHYTNTATNFTSTNPILLVGQLGIETDDLLTAPKYKIGDGVTAWDTLPYNSSGGGGLSGLTTNKVLKATSSTTAGDSNITDDGTNVIIATPTTQATGDLLVGGQILDSTGNSYTDLKSTYNKVAYNGGTGQGFQDITDTSLEVNHTVLIDLNAPSVKKNGVEVATVNDIPSLSGYEQTSNKSSSYTASSTTTYANTKALVDGLSTKLEITNNLSDLNNAITARTTNLKMYDMFLSNGNQTTTSNVASNITDLVTPTLTANKRYKISGVIHFGCNNSGGVKYQITVPSGSTIWVMGRSNITNANTIVWAPILSSATLSTSFAGVNNADYGALCIDGEISIGATAGVIQFGFASATNTQTSTVYQLGTQLTLTQIN